MANSLNIKIDKIENGFTVNSIVPSIPGTPFIPARGDTPAVESVPAIPMVQKSYYVADASALNDYLVSLSTDNFGE